MKKRILSLLMCLCLALSLLPGTALAAEQYDDVSGHWAHNAIARWSDYKIIQGSDGHFRPNDSLSRAEMAVILSNTLGLTEEGSENPFQDVAADAWYTPYVLRCNAAGIMKGDGTNANPTATITRQEAMVMLCRALSIGEKADADLSAYSDADSVADWAKGSVAAMVESGIVAGVSADRLAPKSEINRASTVTILDRAVVQYINTPGSHTLTDKDGIILVAAAGNVTLTGKTSANILVSPAAKGKAITFNKATVTGTITVQADNMKVLKKASTLPEIVTVGKNITVENVKPTGGSTGSTGSTGNPGISDNNPGSNKPSVTLTVKATGEGGKLAVGDKLTATVSNAGGAKLVWNVGGFDREDIGIEYTVSAADLGKEIFAKLVEDDKVVATSSTFTVSNSTMYDPYAVNQDTVPVVLGDSVQFKNDKGEAVDVDQSKLVLSIEKQTVSEDKETEVKTDKNVVYSVGLSVLKTMGITGNPDEELTEDQQTALTDALEKSEVKAVKVDLTVTTTTTDESTGESKTETTTVHPVGKTTVTLSAAQLGMAGEDLNLYHFVANHTNKDGETEAVAGVVDTKGESVTFETNGLSTIWIGNIPPRTVEFDTGSGGTPVASQKVKFGNRVNTAKLPEKIERPGYLFCGWNYDLTVTPIIANMTGEGSIKAVWVSGTKAPSNSFTAELSVSESNIKLTTTDGQVTVMANNGAENLAANLKVNVSVEKPGEAARYAVSSDAQTAAAAKDLTSAPDNVSLKAVTVTDANGKVVAGKTSYYIKWVDVDGNVMGVEEILVVVDDGQGAAESKTVTRNVNRGLGRFEPYLTSSTKTDAPNWVGYINGNLNRVYNDSSIESYELYFNVGFERHFSGHRDETTGEYVYDYEAEDYDILNVEFTPFEGEDFGSKDISARFEYYDGSDWVEVPCTPTQADGKLMVTLDTNPVSAPETEYYLNVNLHLTVDGTESRIHFNSIPNPKYADTANQIRVPVRFTDMETLKEALTNASTDKEWNIIYSGTEPQFTITESIDIPKNCHLFFRTIDSTDGPKPVSATVDSGVTITTHSPEDDGSFIVCDGVFTINGSIVANSDGSSFTTGLHCDNITVASGGSIKVEKDSMFVLRSGSGSTSTCTLAPGSTVIVAEEGMFEIYRFDRATLAGQIDITDGRLYMQNDNNTVSGTININAISDNYWNRTDFYGTTTVESTGTISATGTIENDINVAFYGPLNNKGTITLSGDAGAYVSNLGYNSQNSGTVEVGGTLYISGTKLVNTGTITGTGTLYGGLGYNTTSYDEQNGLEYVEASEPWTPDNYSRYQFTKDPAKTVKVVLFKASLSNEQGGTCSLKTNFEEYPEN